MDFATILMKLIEGIPFSDVEKEAAVEIGKGLHAVYEHMHQKAQEAQPPADPTPSAGSDSPANGGSEPAGTSPGV